MAMRTVLLALAGTALAAPQRERPSGQHNSWGGARYTWWDSGREMQGVDCGKAPFKYVAVISIDGMHASDVDKYLAARPASNISMLLQTAYEYTNAYTSAPSDSFPGTMAQYTGGEPAVTSVWYDDTWAWDYWPAGNADCSGPAGAEVDDTEDLDYNSTLVFSGGINPANLPMQIINGKCSRSYPHNRLRVNTVFEVVREHGMETAYSDKHPAYDIVRGPSGNGLNTGFFPEIEAVSGLPAVEAYDAYRVDAFTAWMDARVPAHSEGNLSVAPSLYGGNFQSVSNAQKKYGYLNTTGNPFTPQLLGAFDVVDGYIGEIVSKMKTKGVYNDTLVVVASKHGQAPINPALYNKVDPALLAAAITVPTAYITTDDIALVYLNKTSDVTAAAAQLAAQKSALKIENIFAGEQINQAGLGNWTPERVDPATPDIIVQPLLGTIYTTSTKKIEEHGGLSADDRNVACFVSNPRLKKQQVAGRVYTTQVAPLLLKALGLNPWELQAVQQTGVQALPGF